MSLTLTLTDTQDSVTYDLLQVLGLAVHKSGLTFYYMLEKNSKNS